MEDLFKKFTFALLPIAGSKILATDGFRVVTATGEVMGDEKIYYTPEAALTEGRRWLGACSRIAENVWLLVKSMN